MYHFFVDREQISGDRIRITGADVNHIKNVLRMRPGEQMLVSNKVDRDYLCEVSEVSAEQVSLAILREQEEKTELPARIFLYQGLPKGDKMELIIQKAVELGVYRLIPVNTRRTVVKLDARKEEARLKRWNAVAESAAKQSKRILIPEVSPVRSFKEALGETEAFDLRLIPYECAGCAGGMRATRKLLSEAGAGMDIAVFIGPEGGFEEEEIALARESGARPVTLGRRILRTETAGICVLSALMLELEP